MSSFHQILSEAKKCKFCKEELSDNNKINVQQKKLEIQKDILCPYCKEKIHKEAIKCKHCGEYLGENIKTSVGEKVLTGASNTFFEINDIIWKTCIVILVLLGIMYACVQAI